MGTNYYLKARCNVCYPASIGCCDGSEREPICLDNGYVYGNHYYPTLEELKSHFCRTFHIGKSSCGWYFLLAIYPEYGINTIDDWKQLIYADGNEIYDEYGDHIEPEALMKCITQRQGAVREDDCRSRGGLPGINGLIRHDPALDRFIVRPDDPGVTYDYIISGNDPERGSVFC